MNTSEATFDDIMRLKMLHEEYAISGPLQDVGVLEAYSYLVEAERAYSKICESLALSELKMFALQESRLHNLFREADEPTNTNDQKPSTSDTPTNNNTTNQNNTEQNKPVEDKGVFRKFIDAIVAFFKKIGGSIASIWNWFVSKWDTYVKSYDSFADKYGSQLDGNTEVTFTGYLFPNLKPEILTNAINLFKIKDNVFSPLKPDSNYGLDESEKNNMANILCGKNDSQACTPDAMKEFMYGQQAENKYTIASQLDILRNAKSKKDTITKSCNDVQNKIKIAIKALESSEVKKKDYYKEKEADIKKAIDVMKFAQLTLRNALSIFCKGVVLQANQAKAICIKALNEKREAEKNKSTETPTNPTTPETPAQNANASFVDYDMINLRRNINEMSLEDVFYNRKKFVNEY